MKNMQDVTPCRKLDEGFTCGTGGLSSWSFNKEVVLDVFRLFSGGRERLMPLFSINRAHRKSVILQVPWHLYLWGPHLDCQHISTHQKGVAETPFTVKEPRGVLMYCVAVWFAVCYAADWRWPGLLRRLPAALSPPPRKHAGSHYLNRAMKVFVDSYHPGLLLFSFLPLYPERPPRGRHIQAAIAAYVNKNATFQS